GGRPEPGAGARPCAVPHGGRARYGARPPPAATFARACACALRAVVQLPAPEGARRRVKVAMLTSSYPRFEGDIAGTFVESLAVEIARLGHDVHVLMPDDGTPRRAGSPGVHEHRFPYAPHDRLRVMGYAKALEGDRRLRYPAYAMAAPYALAGFAWLERLTARHGCDVVHAHWVLPNGPIGTAVARALARPFVISLPGSDVYLAEKAPLLAVPASCAGERRPSASSAARSQPAACGSGWGSVRTRRWCSRSAGSSTRRASVT